MMEETSDGSHWVTAEPDMESGGDGKIVYRTYRIRHHKTTSYLIIGYISNKECYLGSNMRDPRETTQVVG